MGTAFLNSILSYIAGFVVLVLFAALVGPGVIDWGRFRAEIETQATRLVGHPVHIEGDINFVILPAPRFKLEGLRVGDADTDPHTAMAEVNVLEGEIALTPLLRGEVEVTRVRLRDFRLTLARDEAGKFNWSRPAGQGDGFAVDPKSISLEEAHFDGGTLHIDDAHNRRSFVVEDVAGRISASTLFGPLSLDATYVISGESHSIKAGIGNFGGDRAFPVNLELAFPERHAQAVFSGIATGTDLEARLDGSIQVSVGTAQAQADDPDAKEVSVPGFQAGLVVSRSEAVLRDLSVTIADATLDGQATYRFDGDGTFDLSLSGTSLTADPFFEPDTVLAQAITGLSLPVGLGGSLELKLDEILYRENRFRGGVLNATIENGGLNIARLNVRARGETEFLVTGRADLNPTNPAFVGNVQLTVGSVGTVMRDFRAGDEAGGTTPFTGPRRLSLRADLSVQNELMRAFPLEMVFERENGQRSVLSGGFSYAYREHPAFGVEVSGDQFDLTPFSVLLPASLWSDGEALQTFDLNLVADLGQLSFGAWHVEDLSVRTSLHQGQLAVEKLSANDGAGGQIELSGSLSQLGTFPAGGIEGRLTAPSLSNWVSVAGIADLPAFQNVDVAFVLRGDAGGEQHLLSADLSGEMGGSDLSLVMKRERTMEGSGAGTLDLVGSLQNDDARALLVQTGFLPGDVTGSGHLSVHLSGVVEEGLETRVRMEAGDVSASLRGETKDLFGQPSYEGRFELSAQRFQQLMALNQWRGPLASLVDANGQDGAVIAGGELSYSENAVRVSNIEAVAGTFRVSGSGSVDRTRVPVKLITNVELGRINLDPLFVTDVEQGPWSPAPLDWSGLGGYDGEIRVSATVVELAGLRFEDMNASASLLDGVLSFTPVTARFADGRLTLGGRFEGGSGQPGIGLTLALEEASLRKAGQQVFDRIIGGGSLTASAQIEGQGRSLLGLVSSLSGRGNVTLRDGLIVAMDLSAFGEGTGSLASMDGFEPLVAQTLQRGNSPYENVSGAFVVEDGILTSQTELSRIDGVQNTVSRTIVDLVRLEFDHESELTLDVNPPLPGLKVVASGPIRNGTLRMDTLPIERALAQRFLMRDLEETGVDDIPAELQELLNAGSGISNGLDAPLDEQISEEPQPESDDAAASDVPADLPIAADAPVPAPRPNL